MQLKNWKEYSDEEKKEILAYWFYDNLNKYNIDDNTKKQILDLIDNCPDFVYDFILLSRSMYGNDMLIIYKAIKQEKLAYLCQVMNNNYLYIEESRKKLEKEFLNEIVSSFEENVVIPNNQTYIHITISKPDNYYKSLKLD